MLIDFKDEDFENKIKKFLNANYVLGVGNWTEGMIMVCKALNLSKQDEIITVSKLVPPAIVCGLSMLLAIFVS